MSLRRPNPNKKLYRLVATIIVTMLRVSRFLRIPSWLIVGRKFRGMYKNWSNEMMGSYIKSFGARLPNDELCSLRIPATFEPRVEVAPEYRLSEDEIRGFWENGFLEPFRVRPAEEMKELGERILKRREEVSSIYGFACDRDRHLEMPEMMNMLAEPAIVERLAQLLGPDLLLWRSQIFFKPPGNNPVGWHQASTYMFEESYSERTIHPPDKDDLFQLTVWIAVDPATRANGCMKFECGSARNIRWIRLGGRIGFHAVNYGPDYEVDESKVRHVEVDAGEALVFAERTVHGSEANKTDHNRLAFNCRVVPSDVQVYRPGKKFHKSAQMGDVYDLTKWNGVIVRGEDRSNGRNKCVPWRRYAGEPVGGPS